MLYLQTVCLMVDMSLGRKVMGRGDVELKKPVPMAI